MVCLKVLTKLKEKKTSYKTTKFQLYFANSIKFSQVLIIEKKKKHLKVYFKNFKNNFEFLSKMVSLSRSEKS